MKLPCALIRDLLPLYHDNVCAPETSEAVEEHLAGCEPCQEFYHNLQSTPENNQLTCLPEITALQRVKKKIRTKYVIISACVLVACVALMTGVGMWLNSATIDIPVDCVQSVEYSREMVLAMPDGTEVVGGLKVALDVNYWDSPFGLNHVVIPIDTEGTEWVMVMAQRITLWESLTNKLGLIQYQEKFPGVYSIALDWYSWQHIVDVTDLKPPKEEWECFISKVYFLDDYDLLSEISFGLPSEDIKEILKTGTVIWERPESLKKS